MKNDNEKDRSLAAERFMSLQTSREEELKEIVTFASVLCGTPIALITMVGEDTQHFRISFGTSLEETPRAHAFCDHTIQQDGVMMISDTGKDDRFVENPLRKGEINVQFYAGAPLKTKDGLNVGSLCVIGHQPQILEPQQQQMLSILAKQVVSIFELEYSMKLLQEQYQQARENALKLQTFSESSGACQLLLDRNLNIIHFNKPLSDFMTDIHGMKMTSGAPIENYLGPDFKSEFLENVKRAGLGEHIKNENQLQHNDLKIWWQFNYAPVYNTDHEIVAIAYSAWNISELKNSQEEIIKREQALQTIAYMQSHELRKPVSSIMGLMSIFKANQYLASKEELMMLERAVDELEEKIQDMITHVNI
ncbi:putative anti-sigma regulatory factor, serine/threonine protein kinase [Pedobacter sp. BAL39]|uniref:GAF domain-containing protein n=1 Tax=Pedobacter sp. BAL39 TaxID=391596 RepID=UPI0001559CE0|nr:GAF domain-containing protein [Pedobacter sp. BAL39]EDM36736.1 putative anti-sigma regulatory factor, serine/threonine protein kinase [Pedobacter sp. BAL39]